MISENEVRKRIRELEEQLKHNDEYYNLLIHSVNTDELKRTIMHCHSIESQLDALYHVLGEKYYYKASAKIYYIERE